MSCITRLRGGLVVMLLACAFSVGAIASTAIPALASDVDYHTTCVGHGFVSGSDLNDGSAFSRVESGDCGGSAYRQCDLYNSGTYVGGHVISDNYTTCNTWSRDYSTSFTECRLYAKTAYPSAFASHNHTPSNYCG